MKLATYRDGTRDGQLVLVSRTLDRATPVSDIAPTLQDALDRWERVEQDLRFRAGQLEAWRIAGAFPFLPEMCMAPLPRAYQWVDGSAYLNHVELVRKSRGATLPPELLRDPLMYQGGSDMMLGAHDDIRCADESWGIDFEAEVAVITSDLAAGCTPAEASAAVRLLVLVNDVSLRELIPSELAKGFGFLQSKPPTAFSPVAVTPDELGAAWDGERLYSTVHVWRNEHEVGILRSGDDMHFSFADLLVHLCHTRSVGAGTIVGSGTLSNRNDQAGVGCIAEQRMKEKISGVASLTPYLADGELVSIEARAADGSSLFGALRQRVVVRPRGLAGMHT
jgi:fumarylacetoacetate (FAA) hydrolase